MRRRELITLLGGAAVWPLAARAQQPNKPRKVGWIGGAIRLPTHEEFLEGMRDLGYAEGRDFVIEWRFAEGQYERHIGFAADLVRRNIDLIITDSTSAIPAIRQTTSTIPVIMSYSIDPVGNGIVASLARPGGNITGLASMLDDLVSKHLDLLRELLPRLSRVGLLSNPASPNHRPFVHSAQAAARNANFALIQLDARNREEIEAAFRSAAAEQVEAIAVLADALFYQHRQRVAELAIAYRLPTIFSQREYAVVGGLICYGESLSYIFRRVAYYADRIFRGAKAADLPVEQPTKFDFVINLTTAKTFGVTVPDKLLALTSEVIE
jgi:putative ABC transport system substrate-binding protein